MILVLFLECSCEALGTILNEANVTTCTQYADVAAGLPVGQCNCKDNIRGRACDMCAEGFFGLVQEPNPGTCKGRSDWSEILYYNYKSYIKLPGRPINIILLGPTTVFTPIITPGAGDIYQK